MNNYATDKRRERLHEKEKHLLAGYLTSISNLKTSKIRGKFMLEINLWVSEDGKDSTWIKYDLYWACPECC